MEQLSLRYLLEAPAGRLDATALLHNPRRQVEAGRFLVACEDGPPLVVSLDGQPLTTFSVQREQLVGAGFEILLGPGERRRLRAVLPVRGHPAVDHGSRGFLYGATLPARYTEGTLLLEIPRGFQVHSESELHLEGDGRFAGRLPGRQETRFIVLPSRPRDPMLVAVGLPVVIFLLAGLCGSRSRSPGPAAAGLALVLGGLAYFPVTASGFFRWSTYPLAGPILGLLTVASGPAAAAILAEVAAGYRRSEDPTVENQDPS